MRGKLRRKRKQKIKRIEKVKQGKLVRFSLANSPKKYKGFSNKYNYQTNIHHLIYKDAVFENVKFHASNITRCNFKNTKLTGVDFYSTNLKGTSFKGAVLNNVVFFNCNLKQVDFAGVKCQNVIFISTNTANAKNLELENGCKVFNTYPKRIIKKELEEVILELTKWERLYKYHVLHVEENKINFWNLELLLEYGEENLLRAMRALTRRKDKRGFYTISAYKNFVERYLKIV